MRFLALLAAVALAPITASAQALGTYAGTSADGSTVQFIVANDSSTGEPELTSATLFFKVVCPGGVSPAISGIGFGPNVDFRNGKLTYVSGQPTTSYFDFTLTYSAANSTLSGSIETVTSQLAVAKKVPTKAVACTSAKQTLTATLQPANVASRSAAPAASYVYDRRGRIIGTQTK